MKFIPVEEVKSRGVKPIDSVVRILSREENNDNRHLEKTCLKMLSYLAKEKSHTIVEVDRLLVDMQRSVICIQRKKRKMISPKA